MAVRTSFTAGEVLAAADLTDTFGAKSNLASPTFTGTPAAPTATAGTNTTQLATTAFVLANRGKVLQVVRATDTTLRTTTSTSYVDVTGMSVTITPQKSTSAILIISNFVVDIYGTTDTLDGFLRIADSSNNAISGAEESYVIIRNMAGSGSRQLYLGQTLIAYATPATTSAVTYKLRFRVNTGASMEIRNGDAVTGQMYAIEVSA